MQVPDRESPGVTAPLPHARAAYVRAPAPLDVEEGVDQLKREVQAETKWVDRKIGRVLPLRKKMLWRGG